MKKYEIMYIIRPTVESESIKTIVNHFNEIFVSYTSEVLEIKELGLKELAYEIDHHKKGYYVWLLVNATPEAVAEFNRVVRITEEVIRFIVVKEGE
ncbi:MAG: 30S ribosomal protein S6 [Tenericutes bacterium GWF2_38_8]|jgi:small subunit ribosomal protein S6|nr:MAG: 30S ribosomal protein S6 [Tenericutes bacterium GWF2_38_8]HBG33212.1 30S ribosomal protein S6 [Acholeplasmataceae bacterium]HCB66691.1 30S ribosomal protein S6 [Acholeplasmataceae bacterium]